MTQSNEGAKKRQQSISKFDTPRKAIKGMCWQCYGGDPLRRMSSKSIKNDIENCPSSTCPNFDHRPRLEDDYET